METKKEFTDMENGWRREVVFRKSGATAGRADVYYHSPCGKRFRSRLQVKEFLGDKFKPAEFDFHASPQAGYTRPPRATKPSRAGSGGGGRHRNSDTRLSRAIKKTIQQRPVTKMLERNYCGLVRQPVTCLLPQSHDMQLAKKSPSKAAQKNSLQLRDSQWLHERRLHNITPIDVATGEHVVAEQLAFVNSPPPPPLRVLTAYGTPSATVVTSTTTPTNARPNKTTGQATAAVKTIAAGNRVPVNSATTPLVNGVRARQLVNPMASSIPSLAHPSTRVHPQPPTPALHALSSLMKGNRRSPLAANNVPTPVVPHLSVPSGPPSAATPLTMAEVTAVTWKTGPRPSSSVAEYHSHRTAGSLTTAAGNAWSAVHVAPPANRANPQVTIATQRKVVNVALNEVSPAVSTNLGLGPPSDMDIHLQEERVRQLKEQLQLAAAK